MKQKRPPSHGFALFAIAIPMLLWSQSTATSQKAGKPQPSAPQAKKEPYREITADDQLHFEFRGAVYEMLGSTWLSGAFVEFGLIDSLGNFISLQSASGGAANRFVDGRVHTKMFGDIIVSRNGGGPFTYAATDTQIKNLRAFLARQPKVVIGNDIHEAVGAENLNAAS